MYEQPYTICKDLVEENWLEFLRWTKDKAKKDREEATRRQRVLGALDDPKSVAAGRSLLSQTVDGPMPSYEYYDLGLHTFWNWYIANKLEEK